MTEESNPAVHPKSVPFVERLLKRCDNGKPVSVRIYQPVRNQSDAHDNAYCNIQIEGLDKPLSFQSWGVDPMQALIESFAAIRSHLKKATPETTWLSGRAGHIGIPKHLPYDDPEWESLYDQMLEVEHARRLILVKMARKQKDSPE